MSSFTLTKLLQVYQIRDCIDKKDFNFMYFFSDAIAWRVWLAVVTYSSPRTQRIVLYSLEIFPLKLRKLKDFFTKIEVLVEQDTVAWNLKKFFLKNEKRGVKFGYVMSPTFLIYFRINFEIEEVVSIPCFRNNSTDFVIEIYC